MANNYPHALRAHAATICFTTPGCELVRAHRTIYSIVSLQYSQPQLGYGSPFPPFDIELEGSFEAVVFRSSALTYF